MPHRACNRNTLPLYLNQVRTFWIITPRRKMCSKVSKKCVISIFTVAEFGLGGIWNDIIGGGNELIVWERFRECDHSELLKGDTTKGTEEFEDPGKLLVKLACFLLPTTWASTETSPTAPTWTKFSHHEDGGGPFCCPQKTMLQFCFTSAWHSPKRDTEFLATGTNCEINKLTTAPVA